MALTVTSMTTDSSDGILSAKGNAVNNLLSRINRDPDSFHVQFRVRVAVTIGIAATLLDQRLHLRMRMQFPLT